MDINTSCVCLHPHDGGGDDDDGNRTSLQGIVLQINFNRVHWSPTSPNMWLLYFKLLLQNKPFCMAKSFFFPSVINQQRANKSGMNCEKKIN